MAELEHTSWFVWKHSPCCKYRCLSVPWNKWLELFIWNVSYTLRIITLSNIIRLFPIALHLRIKIFLIMQWGFQNDSSASVPLWSLNSFPCTLVKKTSPGSLKVFFFSSFYSYLPSFSHIKLDTIQENRCESILKIYVEIRHELLWLCLKQFSTSAQ